MKSPPKRRPSEGSATTQPVRNSPVSLDQLITRDLEKRHTENLYRIRHTLDGPQGIDALVDGQRYLAFCSNDYLGLANHPTVVEALRRGAHQYGAGSGASHLVTGHSRAHSALEEELADFTRRERALLFSTGYMANLGVTTALVGRGDAIFEDRLNHASLVDAAVLSRARLRRYGHANPNDLVAMLANDSGAKKMVLTDGIFSMDGDMAPLPDVVSAARRFQAWLMVDDAHGLGVTGPQGMGTLAHYGLNAEDVPVLMGTLGKAFGTFGAFVAGSKALIEVLIQTARSYIYTTALPAAIAEATRASLKLVREESWRRRHLHDLVARFKRGAARLGLPVMDSNSPIQPVVLGDHQAALDASEALRRRGIYIVAIRPPTVPQGSARLRVTFSAAHEFSHVDRLLDALADLFP